MSSSSRSPRPLVLGAGGWGTAIAIAIARAGHRVRLWTRSREHARELLESRTNERYLPGRRLDSDIEVSHEIEPLASGSDVIFSVIPTQHLRNGLSELSPHLPAGAIWVSCSKGIERETLRLPSEIIAEVTGTARRVVFSGPSHAEEVSRDLPTTVVAASSRTGDARVVQDLFDSTSLRVYTGEDRIGAEIGGAFKNVIAIAAGISDGLGYGDNSRAGIITRGLVEITRLGVALGARRETFSGLSGMGDLITTCTSLHSRNRAVGHRLGEGETLAGILATTHTVAEGVETARSVHALQVELEIEMPISREVHAVLHEDKPAREAVRSLMSRSAKSEAEELV